MQHFEDYDLLIVEFVEKEGATLARSVHLKTKAENHLVEKFTCQRLPHLNKYNS